MLHRYYINRLKIDLEHWAEQGWIDPDAAAAILADAAGGSRTPGSVPNLLAILGAVLVAAGALLFLAANWEGMGRLPKLAVVFGALWGSYAASWLALRAGAKHFAEAMLLLGVLLFGAGIMLIGQIYHLSADPPAGVLLWALGAILAAWAWPSEIAACAALALISAWFSLAASESALTVYWPFLPVWISLLIPIIHMGWPAACHAALASLAWFVVATLISLFSTTDAVAGDVLRLGSTIAVAFLALGALFATFRPAAALALLVERYALAGLLGGVSVLALPWLHSDTASRGHLEWLPVMALPVILAAGAAFATWRRNGDLLAPGALLLVVVNLVPALMPIDQGWIAAIVLNVALVAALIGLIALGYRRDDRFIVNLGFLVFACTILRLYFDTFWMLFDRSLFFMLGGLLAIALGWFLERKRRTLIGDLRGAT